MRAFPANGFVALLCAAVTVSGNLRLVNAWSPTTPRAERRQQPSPRVASERLLTSTTRLYFGIPSFLTPKDDQKRGDDVPAKNDEDKKIGWSGVVQLITAGMGAPFLGDYQGVDEETGNFIFSLEANNLVDEQGRSKQTQMPYFESGWVDPEDERRAAEGFKFPWQK